MGAVAYSGSAWFGGMADIFYFLALALKLGSSRPASDGAGPTPSAFFLLLDGV
jgi:hypothetical protein